MKNTHSVQVLDRTPVWSWAKPAIPPTWVSGIEYRMVKHIAEKEWVRFWEGVSDIFPNIQIYADRIEWRGCTVWMRYCYRKNAMGTLYQQRDASLFYDEQTLATATPDERDLFRTVNGLWIIQSNSSTPSLVSAFSRKIKTVIKYGTDLHFDEIY